MRNIKTDNGFAVLYDHNYSIRNAISGCGLVASWRFESPRMMAALEKLFECDSEHKDFNIAAIEITREGIKAHFERKPDAVLETPKVQRHKARRKK